jgi:hypothetical protein
MQDQLHQVHIIKPRFFKINFSLISSFLNSKRKLMRSPCCLCLPVRLSVGGINCCWSSPAQSFSVPSAMGLITIFYCFTTLGVVLLLALCASVRVSSPNVFVLCAVRVVSKESRRFVLPRTSCDIVLSSTHTFPK